MARASTQKKAYIFGFIGFGLVVIVAITAFIAASTGVITSRGPTVTQSDAGVSAQDTPELRIEVVAENFDHPWDLAFLPNGGMLVNEREGRITLLQDNERREIALIDDVAANGEGGLLGIAVDREFTDNQFIYTCYASDAGDVRAVRWRMSEDQRSLADAQPIVTGIPLNPSGRHSGCRVQMDAKNTLWIGTGDAAIGTNPQDPESLGGKILRVDRDGDAVTGNLGAPFDDRIYSYGHRNTQGLALYEPDEIDAADGSFGFSVEHGPGIDDEVNQLVPGNFGWDPVPFYNERVSMTDLEKYPDAVTSVWNSGNPTIAPSGATILRGEAWGAYEKNVAIAVLKDEHVRFQAYDTDGQLSRDDVFFKGQIGRIRTALMGPDGSLYLTTDNGRDQDQIIRVTPEQ